MKKFCALILLLISFASCKNEDVLEAEITAIPMDVNLVRFDQAFAKGTAQDLPRLKSEYPMFFPKQVPDSIWVAKFKDTIQNELNVEVAKKFPQTDALENDLLPLFQHLKYYFPNFKSPSVYTVTSDVDYRNKVIAADSLLIIALDTYLGKDHFFYTDISTYIAQNFEEDQITQDIVKEYGRQLIPPPDDRTLLAQMVYYGKRLYLADILLPQSSDAQKIGYTEEQMAWTKENEIYMWRYFVENELLYSSEPKMLPRFINPAPFTKFYLEIDNESPGRLGRYIGWQIVRAFMEKNDVTPQQLLSKSSTEIFNKSKYKPKK